MRLENWLAAMAGAAALAFVALPAQAASTGLAGSLEAAGAPAADVQLTTWGGRRHRYRPYYYGPRYHYGPGYRYRDYHYGPGFRFYFGPRYHRRYRHW